MEVVSQTNLKAHESGKIVEVFLAAPTGGLELDLSTTLGSGGGQWTNTRIEVES